MAQAAEYIFYETEVRQGPKLAETSGAVIDKSSSIGGNDLVLNALPV
jgi:hypothetical protein